MNIVAELLPGLAGLGQGQKRVAIGGRAPKGMRWSFGSWRSAMAVPYQKRARTAPVQSDRHRALAATPRPNSTPPAAALPLPSSPRRRAIRLRNSRLPIRSR